MSASANGPRAGNAVTPMVSVIVRSMARPTLAAALASIAAQDYPAIGVVVVAACGPTHPPLDATVAGHPARLVASARALSRPEAANCGLDAAGGDWITFLDDDDVFLPGHVSALVAAQRNAGQAKLVYTLAAARMADGSTRTWGQPFALAQLYERNFIHLSMALFSRDLVALGCRFDDLFEIMQDWDFFLQCAQHTRFHFEPHRTFEWRADIGTSGAGAGVNQDDARFAEYRDRIYAKWAAQHDALADRITAAIDDATARARGGDLSAAEVACREVLTYSQNDPFALNVLAMLHRRRGDLAAARETQELAVAVRPQDPSLLYNLALLCRLQDEMPAARAHCEAALKIDPAYAPARRLLAELGN